MRAFIVLLGLICSQAFGQGPQIFQQYKPIILSIDKPNSNPNSQSIINWSVDKSSLEFRTLENSTVLHCWAAPGNYTLTANITTVTVNWDERIFSLSTDTQQIRITVTGTSPQPDPIPDPTPNPDEDASINPAGFTVLILHEAQEFNLSEKTLQILNSTKIKAYLNAKTVKESGGFVAWRSWDDDYSDDAFKGQSSFWTIAYRKAIQSSNGKRPWLLISTKDKTVQFDLSDKTELETLALLKKYGGE